MPARFSLAGKLAALLAPVAVVIAALAAALSSLDLPAWQVFFVSLVAGVPLGLWIVDRWLRPVRTLVEGLSDAMRSLKDGDFSVRVNSERSDELGELARLYNQAGDLLREERSQVRQRELLLQSALDESPVAIVLVNALDRVLHANREARRLLTGGGRLEGRLFSEIVAGCPPEMRRLVSDGLDGVFTVELEAERGETYHLAQRRFHLNRRRHRLVLLRRITAELGRQEAEIWKKVIRVMSHEVNNSLAPISSLAHSAQVIARRPEHAHRAEEVYRSIRERVDHLAAFLEGYARFARLPAPDRRLVDWREFLAGVATGVGQLYGFALEGEPSAAPGFFDPAQLQQALINLLKNAAEASNARPDVTLRIAETGDGGTLLQVLDRGRGMDGDELKKALLPFYSTKRDGSGLGLPLCREIVEAHQGRLAIQSREGGGTIVSCWLPGPPARSA